MYRVMFRSMHVQDMSNDQITIICTMTGYKFINVPFVVQPSTTVKKLKHMICEIMVDRRMSFRHLDIRLQFGTRYMMPPDMLSAYGLVHDDTVLILREDEPAAAGVALATPSSTSGVALATPSSLGVALATPTPKNEQQKKQKSKQGDDFINSSSDDKEEPVAKGAFAPPARTNSSDEDVGRAAVTKREQRYEEKKMKQRYEEKTMVDRDLGKMTTEELLVEANIFKNMREDGMEITDEGKQMLASIKVELQKRRKNNETAAAAATVPEEPYTPKLKKKPDPWAESLSLIHI